MTLRNRTLTLPTGINTIYNLQRTPLFLMLKFIYSEKTTKFYEISPYFWLALHRTKARWRFRKILWPSQNIWTLALFLAWQFRKLEKMTKIQYIFAKFAVHTKGNMCYGNFDVTTNGSLLYVNCYSSGKIQC